jgi:RNA polymerase sigma-70 factor (ECF subfamily)
MNPASPASDPHGSSAGFGSTEWSLVLAAGKEGDGSDALERLCRKYWRPMYVHIRRMGISQAEAEDATQGFFVYLIEKGWIGQADPNRGSFRALLRTLLHNYLSNQQRIRNAGKRSGVQISINTEEGEKALAEVAEQGKDPVAAYEASWARSVLQAAWDRLAGEQAAAGKAAQFESLLPYVTQPPTAGEYERLARLLGIRRGQVALIIHRLTRRYADLVRAEVAETLADRSELESELRHLLLLTSR